MSSEVKANKLSPATGTDVVLGDASDTFTIPASATLDVNGTIDVTGATVTGLSAGKVLQVVNLFYTTAESIAEAFNNTDWTATGLTLDITPTSTSNKILIITTIAAGGADGPQFFNLMRGATAVCQGTQATGLQQNCSWIHEAKNNSMSLTYTFTFLDSPSTTSATTYLLNWQNYSGTAYLNSYGDTTNAQYVHSAPSSMTLMEIEG